MWKLPRDIQLLLFGEFLASENYHTMAQQQRINFLHTCTSIREFRKVEAAHLHAHFGIRCPLCLESTRIERKYFILAVLLSADGTLRIIDIEAHGVVLSVFDIHPMPISVYGTRFTAATCAALTAGIRHGGAGACLATGGKDATIRIWNLANVTGGVGNTDASDRILDLELNTGADVSSLAWLDGDTTSSFDSNSGEDDTNRDYAHAPKPKLVSGTEQGSLCIWNVYH